MSRKNLFFIIGLTFGYSISLKAACINELDCLNAIEGHTQVTRDAFLSDLAPIANAQQEQELYWEIFFSSWLKFNTEFSTHTPTPNATLEQEKQLFKARENMQETRGQLVQLKIDALLKDDVEQQALQTVLALNITPNVQAPTQNGIIFVPAPPPNNDLIYTTKLLQQGNINGEQQPNELQRIDLLTHLLAPTRVTSSSKQFKSQEDKHKAILQDWYFLSQTSVVLSSLYRMLAKRTEVTDLGLDAAISSEFPLADDISTATLEKYLASYRTQDHHWSQSFDQATLRTLLRSQLYSEISLQHKLYQAYLDYEHKLATITIKQMQSFSFLKAWREILDAIAATQRAGNTPSLPKPPTIPEIPDDDTGGLTTPPNDLSGSSHCFIATHIYGPNTTQVLSLRAFRDDVLLHSESGTYLTEGYYLISPDITTWLNHHPTWSAVIGSLLDSWVQTLTSSEPNKVRCILRTQMSTEQLASQKNLNPHRA